MVDFECAYCGKIRLEIDRVIGNIFCIYCLEGEEE